MPEIIRSADVYIQHTEDERGRGAFAARDFRRGEVVEVAPVMLLATLSSKIDLELRRRTYDWPRLGGKKNGVEAIAFGYGSMYNHANPANMRYAADNQRLALVFTAVRDIAEGEELTINYNAIGGGSTWHEDHWFETYDVKRI